MKRLKKLFKRRRLVFKLIDSLGAGIKVYVVPKEKQRIRGDCIELFVKSNHPMINIKEKGFNMVCMTRWEALILCEGLIRAVAYLDKKQGKYTKRTKAK